MRDYDPTTGRYLQADPLGLVDGASVYGYARQGPVRWTDRQGFYTLSHAARSLERRGVKGLGKFGEFTEEQLFDEWLDLEREEYKRSEWSDDLLPCPCNMSDAGPESWGTSQPIIFKRYHPEGVWELRSKPNAGGHGNQCVYKANGRLIQSGDSAGTADFVSPGAGLIGHSRHDVRPYDYAMSLGRESDYRSVRPIINQECFAQ